MIITCDSCGTSFKVKSSMIKETGSTVRCSKCQYLFIAYPPAAEAVTPIELLSDEKIETSIDETFGQEADEKIISDIFGEEESVEDGEDEPEAGAALRDLEAEIDADMNALSREIDEDLFDETEMRFDALGGEAGEPEILLSDLEEEDAEMIDLEDLENTGGKTIDLDAISAAEPTDVIDLGDLLQADAKEAEEVFFDDLESEGEAEEILLDNLEDEAIVGETLSAEEELDFESLETETPDMDETIIIEDFEIGKDDVAQSEFADFEDLETDDQGEISLETVGAEDDLDDESLETAVEVEETEAADFADSEFESEGGVEAQLEEFEAEKEPRGKKPSVKAAAAGKKEPEKAPPTDMEAEFELDFDAELEEAGGEEKGVGAEDLELDFDLDEAVTVETVTDTKEFELDFESELDDMLADEDATSAGAKELDLDFDLEEPSAVETSAETEEFELDLEEEFSPGEETAAESEEFDLDFEGEDSMAEELESAVSAAADDGDLGLDLDLDAFDLDLENVEAEDIGEEDFDLDLEAEDLDLKTQMVDLEADDSGEADEIAFDLDLELSPEDKTATGEEEFILDLDIEPEDKSGDKETAEFELDFEEAEGEEPGFADSVEGWGEADAAPVKKTSEELDLSEIEDFLDFGEEETVEAAEPAVSVERVDESGSDTLDMDMDLDFETVTAPEEEEETGEIEIDLETMIDEEIGMEKEVSLETTEERRQRITEEYRKEVEFAAEPEEEFAEVADETAFEEDVTAVAPAALPVRDKRRLLKPILLAILALLLSGVLIYAGIKFFGAPKEVPEAVDPTGKLQIEMIRNPEYAFVVNDSAGELFVVTGHVTNRYDQPRSHIQVKATIYDAAGKVVVTSGAYCGNTLSDKDLSTLDLETINRRLSNRGGDANANVGVQPGARVPFTVVFSNLPENIDEMTVEVVASAR